MDEKICYCFDFSKADIDDDLRLHSGRSTIVEQIVRAKQSGKCRCADAHPQGR